MAVTSNDSGSRTAVRKTYCKPTLTKAAVLTAIAAGQPTSTVN